MQLNLRVITSLNHSHGIEQQQASIEPPTAQWAVGLSLQTALVCEVSRPTARTIVNYRIYDFMTEYTEWIYR